MKKDASVKSYLIEKLKQEHCLWSYDNDSIHDMPDDMLIDLGIGVVDLQRAEQGDKGCTLGLTAPPVAPTLR